MTERKIIKTLTEEEFENMLAELRRHNNGGAETCSA